MPKGTTGLLQRDSRLMVCTKVNNTEALPGNEILSHVPSILLHHQPFVWVAYHCAFLHKYNYQVKSKQDGSRNLWNPCKHSMTAYIL